MPSFLAASASDDPAAPVPHLRPRSIAAARTAVLRQTKIAIARAGRAHVEINTPWRGRRLRRAGDLQAVRARLDRSGLRGAAAGYGTLGAGEGGRGILFNLRHRTVCSVLSAEDTFAIA
jgi:hypothetical protein